MRVAGGVWNSSGSRSFYSDQTMVVHYNDGPEPATAQSKEMKLTSVLLLSERPLLRTGAAGGPGCAHRHTGLRLFRAKPSSPTTAPMTKRSATCRTRSATR